MILQLIYKCRACEENRVRDWPLPDNRIVVAVLANVMGGEYGANNYQSFDFHTCEDGLIGVMDLIGAREANETSEEHFCSALWEDKKGRFCSVAAAEGHSGLRCSYTEGSCHVVDGRIVCGGGGIRPTGVCEDFEPAPWLRKKLLGEIDG